MLAVAQTFSLTAQMRKWRVVFQGMRVIRP
jgi:hypothetical protein